MAPLKREVGNFTLIVRYKVTVNCFTLIWFILVSVDLILFLLQKKFNFKMAFMLNEFKSKEMLP